MISKLKTLSVVLPCHNEELVIHNSWEELTSFLEPLLNNMILDYELIVVNNGSTDGTLKKVLELQKRDKKIKIVDLRNNYGYQGSITAGLYNASNDMVVTIDADLQDDPSKIKEMIQKHYEGFDLVLGVRVDRMTDSFFKRNTASIFYKLLNMLGVKSVPHHGDFRLISKELLSDLKKYNEKNRYIRGLVLSLESKFALVEYNRRARKSGETKFKPAQLIDLALDAITSFSISPIRVISILGFITFVFSLFSAAYILYQYFVTDIKIQGWAFIAIIVSIFGGLNAFFIGVVGEYVGRSYLESKNRPIFVIRKIYDKKNAS